MNERAEKQATPEALAEIDRQAEATAQRSIDKLGRAFRAADAAQPKTRQRKAANSKAGEG